MKKLFLITFLTLLSLTTYSISEAQKSLENTLKEFQAGKMIDSTDVESAVIAPVFKKMTYKIKNITENENEADIELGIKAVDLGIYMEEYANTVQPSSSSKTAEENAIKFFTELKNRNNLKYIETDIIIRMEKTDGEWFIVNNDEIIDAITGNLSNMFE
ncbi:hypothetical protein [uncultured Fusobacterium sp.]|uniref:hypothetical protein n=1 Tax=uncultured Fusobacterium sp. TaxID=159267 RepID=UPI0027DDBFE5|nr:hypothetical protein [uncultured Fusobacterium sp.]